MVTLPEVHLKKKNKKMNKQERGKTCWKVEAWHLRRSVFPSTQRRILQRQHVLLDEEQRKFHFGAA